MSRAPASPAVPAAFAMACALLLCARAAGASEWGRLVEASDRTLDPAILEAFETGDYDTKLSICEAMGRRSDPLSAGLLAALLADFSQRRGYRGEHLLRVLLESLFDPRLGPAVLRERYEANTEQLLAAESRWDAFADPQLKAALLRILPLFDQTRSLPLLMAAGKNLIDTLEKRDGLLPQAQTGLLLDFLTTVEGLPDSEFLDPCLEVARLSREKTVIDRARAIARKLRAGMR
jgi:hypothetical protein